VDIHTQPMMPVMADGFSLGDGPLSISIRKCALTVMAGETCPTVNTGKECLDGVVMSNLNTLVKA
jgi:hypothetical protein